QRVGEQAAAHADPAMDAPDRELDADLFEGVVPGKDVLVDAVDQRPVEVEKERGCDALAHAVFLRKKRAAGRDSAAGASPRRTSPGPRAGPGRPPLVAAILAFAVRIVAHDDAAAERNLAAPRGLHRLIGREAVDDGH